MNNIENNLNLDKSLLILDDDDVFRNRLITAMKRKGYEAYGAASVQEAKSLLSEKFPKILQTFEPPEQDYGVGALEPLQTNLTQQSQKTKKVCGACGDSWPEEVSFCPSCGWDGLPC